MCPRPPEELTLRNGRANVKETYAASLPLRDSTHPLEFCRNDGLPSSQICASATRSKSCRYWPHNYSNRCQFCDAASLPANRQGETRCDAIFSQSFRWRQSSASVSLSSNIHLSAPRVDSCLSTRRSLGRHAYRRPWCHRRRAWCSGLATRYHGRHAYRRRWCHRGRRRCHRRPSWY
jgi:hypothetical protein